MKILAIRGCNLASLEGEFEVNFRVEPLRSAGLYAITGNTGAGKTTILDAMCIALYKRSPRLENVKRGTQVEGNGASTVSESDVRTILQRGKHKGYAEVDFLAVDGNEYRVRWSVSRTHNSPTGNLTAATQDLTNLTNGEHRKLSANEAKIEIPRLVGLEYEQFTRAVLLAQGNFSAFLKAEDNEKALMLETLTGTHIYSRISTAIYSKTQEVKKELELIEAKRKALQLLDDEEVVRLNNEKKRLSEEFDENKRGQATLKEKLNWLIRFATLNEQIDQAGKQLAATEAKLTEAQPTIEKLKLVDSVQQVRDDYLSLRILEQQHTDDTLLTSKLEKQLDEYNAGYIVACRAAETALTEQERINAEYIKAQPLITEAAQLEKLWVSDCKIYDEQLDEIKKLCAEREKNIIGITACKREKEALINEANEKRMWLEMHAAYSRAIPMIPGIIANIKLIDNEVLSVQSKQTTLSNAQKLLAAYEQQLLSARKSEEALKQTMSSEIALLRKRLVEGEPCPVCGSRHHEVVEIAANLLEEKQLEKAKEENRLLIEHIEKNLSNCKIEIETLQNIIEQHNNNILQYRKANIGYLEGVDNAQQLLEKKDASTILKELASNWKSYNERLVTINNEIVLCTNKESNFQARLQDIEKELHVKQEKSIKLKTGISECKERIMFILGNWKSSDEIQQHYNRSVANANKACATAIEQKGKIDIERNRLKGQITEKKKQASEVAIKIELLTKSVNGYLSSRKDNMELSTLDGLLTIGHATIKAMRESVEALEKEKTTAYATLCERKQNLQQHTDVAIKPNENEDASCINSEIAQLEKKSQEINEHIIQINAQLLKDEKNKTEFSQYSNEYDAKRLQMSHWSTLCDMFGSSNGNTLMKLAQGYTLDILLDVANIHLSEMTGRYKLARIADDSLSIKVVDLDMMSESRSAHTLSGGETFIVSLALSLALSSLSSNQMSIESLFIDEGFGALDKETLQTALALLETLQSRGRKIGVISHLSEMLEQIPVKINVKKVSPGKSRIEIKENKYN